MSEPVQRIGMKPTPPGEFVRTEVLESLGLDLAAAARVLGIRRATLSDFVNGKAGLSPEMALRLEKAFGLNMETLLRMQAWSDAVSMRERADTVDVQRYVPSAADPT